MLGEPVSFDVTEHGPYRTSVCTPPLGEPVSFDVTELNNLLEGPLPTRWESRFLLMSRNSHQNVYYWVVRRWESRFLLMSRNGVHSPNPIGLPGWESRFLLMSRNTPMDTYTGLSSRLGEPVSFDVTEPVKISDSQRRTLVGRAGFF